MKNIIEKIKPFLSFDNIIKIIVVVCLIKMAFWGFVKIDYKWHGGFPVDIDNATIHVEGDVEVQGVDHPAATPIDISIRR